MTNHFFCKWLKSGGSLSHWILIHSTTDLWITLRAYCAANSGISHPLCHGTEVSTMTSIMHGWLHIGLRRVFKSQDELPSEQWWLGIFEDMRGISMFTICSLHLFHYPSVGKSVRMQGMLSHENSSSDSSVKPPSKQISHESPAASGKARIPFRNKPSIQR